MRCLKEENKRGGNEEDRLDSKGYRKSRKLGKRKGRPRHSSRKEPGSDVEKTSSKSLHEVEQRPPHSPERCSFGLSVILTFLGNNLWIVPHMALGIRPRFI